MALEAGAQKKVSDLEEQGDVAGLEALKTEIEQVDMDFESAGDVQQAIDRLNEKARQASTTSSEEISAVTSMDGDPAEIDKRTAGVDRKINIVKEGAEAEVSALENTDLEDGAVKGNEKTPEDNLGNTAEQRPHPEGVHKPALEMATKSPVFAEFKKAALELNSLTNANGESVFENKFDSDADIAKTSFYMTLGQQEPGTRKGLDEVATLSQEDTEELIKLTKKGSFDLMHSRRVKGIVERFNKLAPEIYAAYVAAYEKFGKEVDDHEKRNKAA